MPRPIQTAEEARALVLATMALLGTKCLDQAAMDKLAPYARQAVRAKGLPPWERDFMEALADLFEAKGQSAVDAASAKFEAALDGGDPFWRDL